MTFTRRSLLALLPFVPAVARLASSASAASARVFIGADMARGPDSTAFVSMWEDVEWRGGRRFVTIRTQAAKSP